MCDTNRRIGSARKLSKKSDDSLKSPSKKKHVDINENCEKLLCSPPKIKRLSKIALSPSSLLNNLELEEPKIEPRRLFSDQKDGYKNVKKALHSSIPKEIIGRDSEITELTEFLIEHINKRESSSMYVSGPPGTGKTATLFHILENNKFKNKYEKVYINCTSMKTSGSIFSNIAASLNLKPTKKTEKEFVTLLEKYFVSSKTVTLLVLDEIDQLESQKQSVLYKLFEWPGKFKSNLILIGIANALDLTDRILPRLQTHVSFKPKLVHFAPYKKEQIVEIIKHRLNEADVNDSFSPVAIQMLAGKIAAISGDIRRALDIGRRAVELVEQSKKILQPVDLNTATTIQPKIELKDVMTVLNNVYSTANILTKTVGDDAFPLQQKIVLCSLILILRKGKNKNVTVGQLHDVYKRVCNKRNILAVDQSEFYSILSLVESRGIVRLAGKKDVRFQKVSLEWNEEEVSEVMKDKNLLAEILDDVSCLKN